MRRLEQLEARLPLAAQVIDLNPGFYGSQVEPVRLVDEWLYLEATVGEERRLMKTDGESFVDLGPELPFLPGQQFLRGEQLIGVTETGVAAWDFATDTLAVLSDRPGGEVLNGETVMWFEQDAVRTYADADGNEKWDIAIDYHDLEGRTFHLEQRDAGYDGSVWFGPVDVLDDTLIVDGDLDPDDGDWRRYLVRGGIAIPAPGHGEHIELDGELLFKFNIDSPHDVNYVNESGEFVMKKPDRLYDFGTGAWTFYGDTLYRYDDGISTEILTTTDAEFQPEKCGMGYITPSSAVMSCDTELWGRERYTFHIDTGMEFLGNVAFGPNSFSASPVGTYLGYSLEKTTNNELFLFDGDQFIPISVNATRFVHMTSTHVLLKQYTEATGEEILQYELLPGDANLDGIFDSADLVALFQLGEYEDDLVGNSTKATGDFDGNGEFDTSDLVLAFQQGTYETD